MRFLAVAALLASAAAFDSELGFELDEDGCVKEFKEGIDYFSAPRRAMFVKDDVGVPSKTTGFAKLFEIEYRLTFKIVRNKQTGDVFVLHHCGTPAVDPNTLPEDAANATTFSVPVKRVGTDTTVTLAFLEELGLFHKLVIADTSYATSPCLQKLERCGDTTHKASWWGDNETERIAHYDGVDEMSDLFFTSFAIANFTEEVRFSATGDPSLLGRAEWVKFVGAFFNKEPEANRVFRDIERSLVETQTVSYNAQLAAYPSGGAPVIAFMTYTDCSGNPSWCPTIGGVVVKKYYQINRPEYKLEAILKAGCRPLSLSALDSNFHPVWGGPNRIIAVPDVKSLHEALTGVDVLVDETYEYNNTAYTMDTFLSNYEISHGDQDAFPFLRNDKVLRLDATLGKTIYGGTDWYEAGVIRPDVFVAELASYTYDLPDTFPAEMFMRNLATGHLPRVLTWEDAEPRCVCNATGADPVYNACVDSVCIIQDLNTLPSPPSPPSPSPSDDGLSGGEIAGIVIGAVVGALLLLSVIFLVSKEKAGKPVFKPYTEVVKESNYNGAPPQTEAA